MNTVIRKLARINDVDVQLVEKTGEKFIPIRPICDVLSKKFFGRNISKKKMNN